MVSGGMLRDMEPSTNGDQIGVFDSLGNTKKQAKVSGGFTQHSLSTLTVSGSTPSR